MGFNIFYNSYNLYRLQDSLAQTASLLIPTIEGRAKSLVITPSPSNWGAGGLEYVNSALQPNQDSLNRIFYLLNNTQQPDLPIDVRRSNSVANGGLDGWDAIAIHELNKALSRCGLNCNDLRNYFNHFTCGRRLSTKLHSFNAKTNELRFNIEYLNQPAHQKTWLTQVCHIRRAVIRTDGIEVIV